MKKSLFFLPLLILLMGGCSSDMYQFDNNTLLLHSKKDQVSITQIPLKKEKIQHNLTSCVFDSFVIKDQFEKYGTLYIESVDLDHGCSWNGMANGYWEELFRDNEKIKSMEMVDRFDIGHYEFSQHRIDGKYKVNFIYLWGVSESLIIIDTQGVLTAELLQKLQSDKKLTILPNEIFSIKGDYNLVENNWYKQYFKRDGSATIRFDLTN